MLELVVLLVALMVVVVNMKEVYLKAWQDIVSINSKDVLLMIKNGRCSCLPISQGGEAFDGFYAKYPEGLFTLFKNEDNELYCSWKRKIYRVSDIRSLEWHRGILGRQLKLNFLDSTVESFMYQSLWAIFLRPLYFFTDVLLADDDWGLAADLPSFFHSSFENDTFSNFYELINGK